MSRQKSSVDDITPADFVFFDEQESDRERLLLFLLSRMTPDEIAVLSRLRLGRSRRSIASELKTTEYKVQVIMDRMSKKNIGKTGVGDAAAIMAEVMEVDPSELPKLKQIRDSVGRLWSSIKCGACKHLQGSYCARRMIAGRSATSGGCDLIEL